MQGPIVVLLLLAQTRTLKTRTRICIAQICNLRRPSQPSVLLIPLPASTPYRTLQHLHHLLPSALQFPQDVSVSAVLPPIHRLFFLVTFSFCFRHLLSRKLFRISATVKSAPFNPTIVPTLHISHVNPPRALNTTLQLPSPLLPSLWAHETRKVFIPSRRTHTRGRLRACLTRDVLWFMRTPAGPVKQPVNTFPACVSANRPVLYGLAS